MTEKTFYFLVVLLTCLKEFLKYISKWVLQLQITILTQKKKYEAGTYFNLTYQLNFLRDHERLVCGCFS